MPAKTIQQFRLAKGIAEGSIKHRPGLMSREVAREMVKGQSPKGLPKKSKTKSIKEAIKSRRK